MSQFLEVPESGVIRNKFLEFLTKKDEWLGSEEDVIAQSVGETLEYMGLGFHYRIDRSAQKLYSATALAESTVRAMVQDAGYVPRFPKPFKAKLTITNKNDVGGPNINYAVGQEIISETDNIFVLFEPVISLAPGDSVVVEAHQEIKEEINAISDGGKFQEFSIGIPDIHKLEVYVDDVLWNYADTLVSVDETSQIYLISLIFSGDLIVRFGDNVFGLIPVVDSALKFVIYHTSGSLGNLQTGAKLDEYNVVSANNVDIELSVVILQGSDLETVQEMAKSLSFFEKSKGALGWDSDYVFSIFQGFPETIWANVWGESKQEEVEGPNIDNINIVFVSAYRETDQVSFGDLATAWLDDQKKPSNIRFSWQEPNILQFNLIITGKVDKNINIEDSKVKITEEIDKYYGVNSKDRRPSVITKEINEILDSLEFFKDQLPHLTNRTDRPEYSLSITGITSPTVHNDMVSIGVLTFNITPIL